MKKHGSAYGLGIISIFLIFAVLCLTVFATLAVSSARADLRLSEKNADYVKKYYEATAECAEFVRQAEVAYAKDPAAIIAPGIQESGRVKYDMTFAIDDNSRLHAAFYITESGCEYTAYEVINSVITSSQGGDEYTGEPDTTVSVWIP